MAEINSEQFEKKWYNRWWGIVFLLFLAVGALLAGIFIFSFVDAVETNNTPNTNSASNNLALIETSDDPALGADKPLITIVEFGDFQCPFCKEEYPIIRRIASQYSDVVKLIYRDFPVPATHPDAIGAALAAGCAQEQGKFWEYHNLLYDNQSDLSVENLLVMAQGLNLNFDQFSQCLGDQKYLNEIQNDMLDGIKLGITGTPTFFINGYKIEGVISYSTWVDLVEKYKTLKK